MFQDEVIVACALVRCPARSSSSVSGGAAVNVPVRVKRHEAPSIGAVVLSRIVAPAASHLNRVPLRLMRAVPLHGLHQTLGKDRDDFQPSFDPTFWFRR